ncbi:hypothetical protein Kpol_1023p37 [Vanderwaltozyma polyspora DSM 70294]|uniref:Small ribosomal subunit protein mS41 n=1 Tax=Vanderwaltozyma polyspora (strain ATCC 22028 / DSM 70294 / BCRC 21397 / CBS 2163 / NBRC 10782 / NRRL Y-8283 / UCD 57-17) TaxID=436907 RepID=A7TFR0_VANPO|nr:uncharacterized protein Kpol_1023p37 [Vanderwaltozyma polyspora DSM 70294]EDO18868.1 hypothetical protein Kpol_1023p37 [Vanderwaltozyma polyspora DSM 70294]
MISRRFLSISRPLLKLNNTKVSIPKTNESIPDVDTFLKKIGRSCHEASETYGNNWSNLFTWKSRALKRRGITAQQRKYILEQVERYKRNKEIVQVDKGKKSFFGGERHRKENHAKWEAEQRVKN